MTTASEPLVELLNPKRLTAVVDVGANPLDSDGEPPYKQMLTKRLCTVVGFENSPMRLLHSMRARAIWKPTCPAPSAMARKRH